MAIAPALKVLMAEQHTVSDGDAFVWRILHDAEAAREQLVMAKVKLKVAKAELKVKIAQERYRRMQDEVKVACHDRGIDMA